MFKDITYFLNMNNQEKKLAEINQKLQELDVLWDETYPQYDELDLFNLNPSLYADLDEIEAKREILNKQKQDILDSQK